MASTTTTRTSEQTRLTVALIAQLVRKDLKVKYQGSTLGFVWSLANPLLTLAVYTVIFQYVFKSAVPVFGLFLLSGLLIWNFFSMGVMGASGSIVGNAGLVKKVPFAHAALPLASIGFAGVQVLLQFLVYVVGLVALGHAPLRPELLLLVPALVVVLTLTTGLGLFVASTTVRMRDTSHILEVAMFAWMWLTPIIYQPTLVHSLLGKFQVLYYLNPMAGVVVTFQRALYGIVYTPSNEQILASPDALFYLKVLGLGFVVSAAVFALGWRDFSRSSRDFAEDL